MKTMTTTTHAADYCFEQHESLEKSAEIERYEGEGMIRNEQGESYWEMIQSAKDEGLSDDQRIWMAGGWNLYQTIREAASNGRAGIAA
jgi:hypothetical protein